MSAAGEETAGLRDQVERLQRRLAQLERSDSIYRKAIETSSDVTLRFGGIVALDGVSFDVENGHISRLIGPNGAGKTTAFNVITRLYTPDDGRLQLEGRSLLDTPPHRVVTNGIARTFQNIDMFSSMSVLENVLVGAHSQGRSAGEKAARTLHSRGAR